MTRMHTTSTSGYSSNASAFAALDGFLERLRSVPDLPKKAAPEVAEKLDANIASNVASQNDIYGHPFRPSQDGYPVLIHAAEKVQTTVNGSRLKFRLDGVEAMHQVGSARGYRGGSARLGGFRRPVIPFAKIPGPWKAILRTVLQSKCAQWFRGEP
jgi:hypothetical protein